MAPWVLMDVWRPKTWVGGKKGDWRVGRDGSSKLTVSGTRSRGTARYDPKNQDRWLTSRFVVLDALALPRPMSPVAFMCRMSRPAKNDG